MFASKSEEHKKLYNNIKNLCVLWHVRGRGTQKKVFHLKISNILWCKSQQFSFGAIQVVDKKNA